jgi:hypothetical protein
MINYILQVLFFQLLFLAVYDLFLKKETFFQWNRFYLIISSILAYVIPYIKIKSIGNYIQQEYSIPAIIINPELVFLDEIVLGNQVATKSTPYFTLENIYLIGLLIMLTFFLIKIIQIVTKIKSNKLIKKTNYSLVILTKESYAFSFFNYIFLGETIYKKEHQQILKHELTHVKQKHSLDLLFFEIQKIVFWFNPFSYVFQKRISTLHEFIADSQTILEKDKTSFFENLLQQTFSVEKIAFVNNYFKKSLLKKRIIMATKNKSKQIIKLKYLLVLPLLIAMLIFTACNEEIEENTEIQNLDFYKLVELDEYPYLINSTEKDNDKRKMELLIKVLNISTKNIDLKNIHVKLEDEKTYFIKFILDKNGNKVNFEYDNIPDYLIPEVKRLIKLIPKINPGIKEGKAVNTKLVLPLLIYKNSKKYTQTEAVPFAIIEKPPIYPGCENLSDKKELQKCFQKSVSKHIRKNFDIKLANSLDLEAGKKRVSVQFIINKNGEIENIKARAPHQELQEEAIRIVKLLPQMIAGEKDGKKVKVRYNLPIVFKVESDKEPNQLGNLRTPIDINSKLAGTISDEFGYLRIDKKTILNSKIGAIDFDTKNKFIAKSFKVSINGQAIFKIKGNKFDSKSSQQIKSLEKGIRLKIFDIIIVNNNGLEFKNVYPINIKIK